MIQLVGKSLGRYHILEPLGEGGMAAVYKAYDTSLERNVAIKIIRTEKEEDESFLKRFQREAKALAQLDHPYILKVLDYGEQDGIPYLVMPYIPGGTLKQRMGHPIPYPEAAGLIAPIARALEFAHGQNIIHRDIKPANILISQSGAPILSDFGIAKMLDKAESTQLTADGVGIGTPDYMAPEQWMGKADPRTDIYSLGIVFYQMITGRLPFTADTPAAVLLKHVQDPLPRPSTFVADLPEFVEHVLFKALSKKPEDRYQDMGVFASALEKLANSTTTRVDLTPPPLGAPETVITPQLPKKKKMETWKIGGIVLAGLALIGFVCLILAGGAMWLRGSSKGGNSTPTTAEISQGTNSINQSLNATDVIETQVPNQSPTNTPVQEVQVTSTSAPFMTIDGLPTDVPLLTENNGDLITSTSSGMVMYTFTTNKIYADVVDFYKTGMEANGWAVMNTTEVQGQQSSQITYMKNETRMVMVNIMQADNNVMINLMIVSQ
jgi:serine/threonine protein kinase